MINPRYWAKFKPIWATLNACHASCCKYRNYSKKGI